MTLWFFIVLMAGKPPIEMPFVDQVTCEQTREIWMEAKLPVSRCKPRS